MTDDEILALAALTSNEPTDAEMIAFARAIAAKEREACAKIVEKKMMMCGDNEITYAIRARGE